MDGLEEKRTGLTKIKMGISAKLSILILFVTFVPLLIVVFLNYSHDMRIIKAESEKILTHSANSMSVNVSEWIDKNMRALVLLSAQPDMKLMKRDSQEKILKTFQEQFPWTYLVFTVDNTGKNVARTDNGLLVDYSDRTYFKEIIAGKPFAFETLIGKTSKKPALVIAVPIMKGEETIGVLGAAMNIDTLSGTVANWKNGKTGYAYLVDAYDKVVSHPKPEFTSGQKSLNADPAVRSGRSGSLLQPLYIKDESGRDTVTVCSKLSYDWLLVVRQDEAEIFASLKQFRLFSALLVLISAILSLVFALFIGRSISHPVLSLADAANKMSLGELDTEINIKSTDEIGVLAESLSRLQTSLVIAMKRLRK